MIKSTTDYKIFKKHRLNRNLEEEKLKKLEISISSRNLLEMRPIDVNSKMEVIDGQHRLEAAKRLQIPIYYQIKEELCDEDMILLNTNQSSWKIDDYFNYYLNSGKKDFILLNNFLKKNKIDLCNGLLALGFAQGGTRTRMIRAGNFTFPENEIEEAEKRIMLSKKIIEILNEKIFGDKGYIKKVRFFKALLYLFNKTNFDADLFIEKKLLPKLNLLHPCTRMEDYLAIFVNMYNFRNENPII